MSRDKNIYTEKGSFDTTMGRYKDCPLCGKDMFYIKDKIPWDENVKHVLVCMFCEKATEGYSFEECLTKFKKGEFSDFEF